MPFVRRKGTHWKERQSMRKRRCGDVEDIVVVEDVEMEEEGGGGGGGENFSSWGWE
jgi:hypothetical protein